MKKFFKKAAFWVASVTVVSGIFSMLISTSKVSATVPETITVEAKAPIMDRIADCESGNGTVGSASQMGKDGQVIIHVNAPGNGFDIGYMQINNSWDAQATKLGFNLYTENGNRAFGAWLYANIGTQPWQSSYHCWAK